MSRDGTATMRNHPTEAVQRGIDRFLDAFRASFGTDAEPEVAEMCAQCRVYPAAHQGRCFSCLAGRLPA